MFGLERRLLIDPYRDQNAAAGLFLPPSLVLCYADSWDTRKIVLALALLRLRTGEKPDCAQSRIVHIEIGSFGVRCDLDTLSVTVLVLQLQ